MIRSPATYWLPSAAVANSVIGTYNAKTPSGWKRTGRSRQPGAVIHDPLRELTQRKALTCRQMGTSWKTSARTILRPSSASEPCKASAPRIPSRKCWCVALHMAWGFATVCTEWIFRAILILCSPPGKRSFSCTDVSGTDTIARAAGSGQRRIRIIGGQSLRRTKPETPATSKCCAGADGMSWSCGNAN